MTSRSRHILVTVCIAISLLGAQVYRSSLLQEISYADLVQTTMNKVLKDDSLIYRLVEPGNQKYFEIFRADHTPYDAFVYIGEGHGYESAILTAVAIDPVDCTILGVGIIKHDEWPIWMAKIEQADLLERFIGKHITSLFTIGSDIDGVSGATLSARGIANGVKEASHILAVQRFNLTPQKDRILDHLGQKEWIVLILLLIGIYASFTSKIKWKPYVLTTSGIILGFWLVIPLTLGKIGSAMIGHFAPPLENITWYIIVIGVPVVTLIGGRNFYCNWLCPFRAVGQVLSFSGINLKNPGRRVNKIGKTVGVLALWMGLVIIVATGKPSLGSFELFSTMFGFEGGDFRWILMAFFLLVGVFIRNFWCRFFCPVGLILRSLSKVRSFISQKANITSLSGTQKRVAKLTIYDGLYSILFLMGAALVVLVWLEGMV